MAVSYKTNNLINCNRCHLPFNFKNTAPKMLSSCKHWYCFNCLEHLLHTATANAAANEQFLECAQCQRSIDMLGMQKSGEQIIQNYEKTKLNLLQKNNNANLSNNYNSDNNKMITFGCEDEFAQKDYVVENGNKTRSASLNSENSIGSFVYFNINHNNTTTAPNVTEQMLPGENCFIHGMPNTLWCQTCHTVLCRGCNATSQHKDHKVENQLEAKEYYQNRVKEEFIQIQVSVEEMQNFKMLQKGFLLKLLETCCSLKLQIEQEIASNSNTADIDEMKETMTNLQLCFGLLGKQTPNEIFKLYKVIQDENCNFKLKHKQMLQQCRMQQLLSKSQRILDFEVLKDILQKLDYNFDSPASDFDQISDSLFKELEAGRRESNSVMILTNYCIYRLYMSYMKQQQQQIIEQEFVRYQQQCQQDQKEKLIKQCKMLQQHQDTMTINNTTNGNNGFNIFYGETADKQKTYAEIATANQNGIHQQIQQIESSELIPTSNGFQPYKKPLAKSYDEPRKTVQLLFNPINNENNQIYFFDFERSGQHLGRVLIKVFADIAPKMSYNFHALATHEKGVGYTGCKVFECHPNESIITGDIEQNTGYSSRSIYEDVQFVPDDTNVAPFAGAVGMRRAKKKFDSQGLVGSQFRIILTELGFTAIFGCVIEGLEVVKKISQTLVQNDKIHGTGPGGSTNNSAVNNVNGVAGIFIAHCGLYEFVKRDLMCGI